MATLLQELASLVAAGTMMVSGAVDRAAPQHDVDGLLFLVNRDWRVSQNYVPETRQADVPGQLRSMRADAASALEEMFAACKEETGVTLTSVSGYRSYSKQATIYNNKLKRVGSKAKADEYVARPGASEHQLGLAMDVGQKSKTNLTASFGTTKGGAWVRENCWRFGFILRYQEGWEDVTGYQYEPWHVRYVGKENAALIEQAQQPLETYLVDLRGQTLLDIVTGKIITED
ncbi:MAG: M15 family metallopeptidase [Aristaeellaceae bacterium]